MKLAIFALIVSQFIVGCSRPSPNNLRCASAHRGEHSEHRENSISAIKAAANLALPFVEVDIRSSADGEFFLFHDRSVNQSNAITEAALYQRSFSSLSSSEVRSIKLPTSEERVPTLVEALDEIRGSGSFLQLDLKLSTPEQLLQVGRVIANNGSSQNVVVMCYEISCSDLMTRAFPEIKLLLRADDLQAAAEYLQTEPSILQVDAEDLAPTIVTEANKKKILVLVKSLGENDSRGKWKELYSRGANIILTDKPREIKDLLNCPSDQLF